MTFTPPHDLSTTPLPGLPTRGLQSHKGTYGRAILIGGSQNMAGAIALAGLACLRSGAGLATLWTPDSAQRVAASFSPVTMTRGFADEGGLFAEQASGEIVAALQAASASAVALGPGIGVSSAIEELVASVQFTCSAPLVIDAEGLNALACSGDIYRPAGPRVLTPHPGEFARLIADSTLARMATGEDADRIAAATMLARRDPTGRTVVLLKGHRTVIADGHNFAVNTTGNPGLATAGAGDVLTGVITALLCQGLPPFDAARLGAHLHGLAGDLAAAEKGQISLIATDVIDFLPAAFQRPA